MKLGIGISVLELKMVVDNNFGSLEVKENELDCILIVISYHGYFER